MVGTRLESRSCLSILSSFSEITLVSYIIYSDSMIYLYLATIWTDSFSFPGHISNSFSSLAADVALLLTCRGGEVRIELRGPGDSFLI